MREGIRKLRMQKELYRLAWLTLEGRVPQVFLQEEPLALLVRRRSALGLRLSDATVEVRFPEGYPLEPADIRVVQPDSTPNQTACKYDLQQLPSIRHWNLSVYVADILEDLVRVVRERSRKEQNQPGSKKAFVVVRNFRQSEARGDRINPKTGELLKRVGVSSLTCKISKQRRKEENIETKNLNRHFRSKLRQILREMEGEEARQLYTYFRPNCVGFKQIRYVLNVKWFNNVLKEELRTGNFLRRIEQSSMGVDSKHLMIKYYPIIEHAVNHPEQFERWKY